MSTVEFVGSFPSASQRLDPPLPEVAFIGRSNVGKSSLLNAVVGRRRIARTSTTPGKTQTLNVYRVEGRLYLVDLPGYGYARVSKRNRAAWRSLVDQYLRDRTELRGVVWLLDIRHDPSVQDEEMFVALGQAKRPILAALTKCDKLGTAKRREHAAAIQERFSLTDDQIVTTSAVTKDGIDELRDAIEGLVAS